MPLDMSGGRHAHAQAPHAASLWKCPACDTENTGPLTQGCSSCGSGAPGRHLDAGDPLLRVPVRDAAVERGAAGRDSAERVSAYQAEDARNAAFLAWFKPFRGTLDAAGEQIIYQAFCAGAQWVEGRVVAQGSIGAAESTDTLKGNAESRTLIAALQLFIAQVLQGNPEEVGSGEWLSAAEAGELVKRIERTQ